MPHMVIIMENTFAQVIYIYVLVFFALHYWAERERYILQVIPFDVIGRFHNIACFDFVTDSNFYTHSMSRFLLLGFSSSSSCCFFRCGACFFQILEILFPCCWLSSRITKTMGKIKVNMEL